MTAEPRRVFLSSTFRDLEKHRQAARAAIDALDGYKCVWMEWWGAQDGDPWSVCKRKIAECDVFICVVGHMYGSTPGSDSGSYTIVEYQEASRAGKPRLVFMATDDFLMPVNLVEPDGLRSMQQEFRARLEKERTCDYFRSPEELAGCITRALARVHIEHGPDSGSYAGGGIDIPLPPNAYFAHPFAMNANFTGREQERCDLTTWLREDPRPVCCLVGDGGTGKSTLAWVWLQHDVLGKWVADSLGDDPRPAAGSGACPTATPDGVVWWSFYDRESSFAGFLDSALIYTSRRSDPCTSGQKADKVRVLLGLLQKGHFLVVLDGFERQLRAYFGLGASLRAEDARHSSADARSCADPSLASFLRGASAIVGTSKILLTTRSLPAELEKVVGCRQENLSGLAPDDAVIFLDRQGMQGTRADMRQMGRDYGYHPLSLRLLAGVATRKPLTGARERRASALRTTGAGPIQKRRRRLLATAFECLDEYQRQLLSQMAAFPTSVPIAAMQYLDPSPVPNKTSEALNELVNRGLLSPSEDRSCFAMHPIVRDYAYGRLRDKVAVHRSIAEYFANVPMPVPERTRTVDDLEPAVEQFYHELRAGEYERAFAVYRDRLQDILYYNIGAIDTCVELLQDLLPDTEERPYLRLAWRGDVAWTRNAQGAAYALLGHPLKALELFELARAACEEGSAGLGKVLANMAEPALMVGRLQQAEECLSKSAQIHRDHRDSLGLALVGLDQARLMWVLGETDAADTACTAAIQVIRAREERQPEGVASAYLAEAQLRQGKLESARKSAALALRIASRARVERDLIRAKWLAGAIRVALAARSASGVIRDRLLRSSARSLEEAESRCQRTHAAEIRPDIVLCKARLATVAGDIGAAQRMAEESLRLAENGSYRLKQAESNLVLAELALTSGDLDGACVRADKARSLSLCDGPGYCYKWTMDQAGILAETARSRQPR